MGYIICKNCYEENYQNWKKPFENEVSDPIRMPEYNENMQHYKIYSVEEVSNTLQNGEMIEILCVKCKMTHIGKDTNGIVKVRYIENTNWTNFNN